MQVQIRFAETGHTTKYIVPINEKISYIQQQIKRDYKVEISDQRVISKSGAMLFSDDRLETIQTQLQRTCVVPQGEGISKIQQLPCIYVFNEKALRSQDPLKSFSEDEILQNLFQRCESTAILREKSEFRPLVETLSKDEIGKLQQINENIKDLSEHMLQHYEIIKTKAYQFTQVKHCNEEVINMCENQVKACQTLYKCLNFKADSLERKRIAILKAFDKVVKQYDSSVKGIQELKTQSVPDKLQPEMKNKSSSITIFDLFCQDNKYNDYLKRTNNILSGIGKKLECLDKQIEDYSKNKGKIYEDKKTVTNKFKTCKSEIIQISSRIEDCSQQADSIRDRFKNKCRSMMEFMSRYAKSSDDTESIKYISTLGEITKQNDKQVEKNIAVLSEWNQGMTKCYVTLHKHQRLNQNLLKDAYRSYEKFLSSLGTVQLQLRKIEKQTVGISKQINSNWNAKDMNEAYNATINQICRRRLFFNKLEASYNQLVVSLDEELQKRKKYITNRRKIHPVQFVPQLMSHVTPSLFLEVNCDLKLPKLDFNIDEEEYAQKSQRKEPDYKKQVLKLKEKLQKYEKLCEGDSIAKALDQITIITNDVHTYKRQKENMASPQFCKWETKIANLEGILTKTAKVFHQLYTKKLKEEGKKYLQVQESLNKQIAELKKRSKIDVAELNRTMEDQMKGCLMEIGKLKEEVIRKEDQIKALTLQMKDTQRNLRYLNDQKQLLSSENFMICDERKQLQEQLEKIKVKNGEITRSLEMEKQLVTQLKILLGDQEVKLIQKEQQNQKLRKYKQQKDEQDLVSQDSNSDHGRAPECMQMVRLKEQNQSLKQELQTVQSQLRLIIMKETFEIQTQTGDYCQPGCIINVDQVQKGKRMIFIPFSNGVYLPVSMVDTEKTCANFSNTTISSYRNNFFLDMGSLEGRTRDFLNECSLIIIAKVGHIRERISSIDDNPFGLKINETYSLIEVQKPEFIIGFEQEDISLKNYAQI